jgi:hypothetical protein
MFSGQGMDKGSCNVIVTGDLTGDLEPEQVKDYLCRTLGSDRAVAETLVSGQQLVIKKNVSRSVAMKYATALRSAGVVCEIEDAAEAEERPESSDRAEEGQVGPGPMTQEVVCPNCGQSGSSPVECFKCGIIYSRYEQGKSGAIGTDGSFSISSGAEGTKNPLFTWILLLVALGVGCFFFWLKDDVRHPPGILVDSDPKQVIGRSNQTWARGTKTIIPLARFKVKARVLSTERYRFGDGSDLAPVDLALGWGLMSDQALLDKLVIAQGNRRYALEPQEPNARLPWREIMSHSSNMHIIPANKEIEKSVLQIHAGDIVELQGYLVGVKERGQWVWFSSLSRTDIGDGACELFWVERVLIR